MEYDINNYTENELFIILGVDETIDRYDLEQVIIQELKRARNDYNPELFHFLKDVYSYFFHIETNTGEEDEESSEEETEEEEEDEESEEQKEIVPAISLSANVSDIQHWNTGDLFRFLDFQNSSPTMGEVEAKLLQEMQLYLNSAMEDGRKMFSFYKELYNRFFSSLEEEQEQQVKQERFETGNSMVNGNVAMENLIVNTQQKDLTKGQVNPILRDTYKRTISIDSQYRDDDYPLSTDFTLNFTETLKNVVSLKLWAVQIPVTWYTISSNYGSNVFYLRPISSTENSLEEIRVEISPGNYDQDTLVAEIDEKMDGMRATHYDISFGTTKFAYNTTTAKSTFTIDIKNIYDQSYYDVQFSGGLEKIFTTDISINQLYPVSTNNTIKNYKTNVPTINTDNNSFGIFYNNELISSIILDIQENRTVEDVIKDLNGKLKTNRFLVNSELKYDISGNDLINRGLYIQLNRMTVKPTLNSNVEVAFPLSYNDIGKFWSETLGFTEQRNEMNTIKMSIKFESNLTNPTITFRPKNIQNSAVNVGMRTTNDIVVKIEESFSDISEMVYLINEAIKKKTILKGTTIEILPGVNKILFRFVMNKIYTTSDYRLTFFKSDIAKPCYKASDNYRNATADTTLGYILGYKDLVEYNLTKESLTANNKFLNPDTLLPLQSYYSFTETENEYGQATNIVELQGSAALNIFLYNYFMIILDDFNQSHLNDGLVTIAKKDTSVVIPSYANRKSLRACGNTLTSTNLTEKQVYSVTQILATQNNKRNLFNAGPFVKDMFALIPIKSAGAAPGTSINENGGSLQQQERVYFGPVNISRLAIKLINDKGDVVDLNNGNWSFQLQCEQLYQANIL